PGRTRELLQRERLLRSRVEGAESRLGAVVEHQLVSPPRQPREERARPMEDLRALIIPRRPLDMLDENRREGGARIPIADLPKRPFGPLDLGQRILDI